MAMMITVGRLAEFTDQGGVLRGGGQRTMTAELLTAAASYILALGGTIAYTAMRYWLPGEKVKAPAKSTLLAEIPKLQAKEAAAKADGDWRGAIYYEVAAFCCRACADEA